MKIAKKRQFISLKFIKNFNQFGSNRNENLVDSLVAKIKKGQVLKPIRVKRIPQNYFYLLDGSHRILAYQACGKENSIPAEIVA